VTVMGSLGLRPPREDARTHETGTPTRMAELDARRARLRPGATVRPMFKVGGTNPALGVVVEGDPGTTGHVLVTFQTADGPRTLPFFTHELVIREEAPS